jgi:hypothetical protein
LDGYAVGEERYAEECECCVTVFAESFEINLCGGGGGGCWNFISSANSDVGDTLKGEDSSSDDNGVEEGDVKVEEGDDGDETLDDVNVDEIDAGVTGLLSLSVVVIPNP